MKMNEKIGREGEREGKRGV